MFAVLALWEFEDLGLQGLKHHTGDEDFFFLNMASSNVGCLEPFAVDTGEWASYSARLDQYLTVNTISDGDLQKATMLTVIGGPAFTLLRDLLAPDAPEDKTFAELKDALKAHLSPQPLVIGERYRFYQRDQHSGESIAMYVADLRRLARTCQFEAHLQEALRDRFVCGLRSGQTRKKLLATDKLTFDTAVATAKADELASRDAVEVAAADAGRGAGTGVNKVRSQPSTRHNAKPGAGTPCFRCGGTNHLADECRFKDTVCRACQKKGHIERVCRSKPSGNRTQRPTPKPRQRYSQARVHAVSETAPHQTLFDSDDEFAIHYVRAPRDSKPPAPIFVQAQVNDRNLRMELDTGAGVSVLPTSMYQQYFSATPLQSSALRLTTYNNEQLICRGVLPVCVVINGQPADTELYVVDCKGPALFGRSWLELFRLDWTAIKAVHTGDQQAALEELKRKYAAVFVKY